MSKVTPNMEDYLEAILVLERRNKVTRVKDIAEFLSIKNPSVTQQIHKLMEMGLVDHKSYGHVLLTREGTKIAKETHQRHLFFAGLLKDVLMIDDATAEEDACRIEHVVCSLTIDRFAMLLRFIKERDLAVEFRSFVEASLEKK